MRNAEQLVAESLRMQRCVVSRNAKHVAPLSKQFEAQGLPHAEAVLIPNSLLGLNLAAIVGAIQRFDAEHPDGVPPYSLWWLSAERE
jgi:hypothetical protein